MCVCLFRLFVCYYICDRKHTGKASTLSAPSREVPEDGTMVVSDDDNGAAEDRLKKHCAQYTVHSNFIN